MKALYRKYRPLRLEDVVGQEQVTVPLGNALVAEKVGHAYLFTGPRGTGKTSVARILAHQVNGFDYQLEDDYVDIVEIDGASNRGIDNIRELREKAAIAPSRGKYKVYIIDEVHMLTKEAFNALLKTLEEPPAHVIFIMATTDAIKVPVTITSRSQIYNFRLVDEPTMVHHLKSIAESEGIKITDEALALIAKRGGGSFRDSLSLLDQISTLTSEEINAELIEKALGLPEMTRIVELIRAYIAGDVPKITTLLRETLESGIKGETIAEELMKAILDNPQPQLMKLLRELTEVSAPFVEAKLLVALVGLASGNSSSGLTAPKQELPDASNVGNVPKQELPNASNASGSFDWDDFVAKVKGLNDAIASQLMGAKYEFLNGELMIYPAKRIARTILSRDNNTRILVTEAGDVKITIGEPGGGATSQKNDALLSQISGIMGGEVVDDGGGNPF